MFDCFVQTDGFGVFFLFARKKRESTYGSTETVFKLEDFSQSAVERFFVPCTIEIKKKKLEKRKAKSEEKEKLDKMKSKKTIEKEKKREEARKKKEEKRKKEEVEMYDFIFFQLTAKH
jgi:hypothetical protein